MFLHTHVSNPPSTKECGFRTVTVPHCAGQKSLFPGSVVDPHHVDADPGSTYHSDADPDSDFYLMRIRIFIWYGCGSVSDFSPRCRFWSRSRLPNKGSNPWKSAQIGSCSIHFGSSSANWCGSGSSSSLWSGSGFTTLFPGSGSLREGFSFETAQKSFALLRAPWLYRSR